MPNMVFAEMQPASTGSSLKDSNPHPPRGDRCMLVVGPRITVTPFARASSAYSSPDRRIKSIFHVVARAFPHGKHVVGVLLNILGLRTPFGPSDTLTAGVPRRSTPCKCQLYVPERRLIFFLESQFSQDGVDVYGMFCLHRVFCLANFR